MRYASVCSGIEAPTVAWHGLGWEPQWFSEIEPFPCAVLQHHYPHVPNLGDMTTIINNPIAHERPIDLLVGGTPCQDFSIAGLRAGLDGARGNLSLAFVQILARLRPRCFVWENVPGVLSSNGGRDFATILGAFTGQRIDVPRGGWENSGIAHGSSAAYGIAWRVLDAQYFGTPQRRRRVFVVGCIGADWQRAAAVLLERGCLRGDPAPRRETGEVVAGTLAASAGKRGEVYNDGTNLVYPEVAGTLQANMGDRGISTQEMVAGAGYAVVMATGQGKSEIVDDATPALTCNHEAPIVFQWNVSSQQSMSADTISPTLKASHQPPAVAFEQNGRDEVRLCGDDGQTTSAIKASPGMRNQAYVAIQTRGSNVHVGDISGTLGTNAGQASGSAPMVLGPMDVVRRLTVVECERLQGFPDYYTRIPGFRRQPKMEPDYIAYLQQAFPDLSLAEIKKLTPDGPAYKALGNSMNTEVMRWIGERIDAVYKL